MIAAMRTSLVSATSVLALLTAGGGHAGAAPIETELPSIPAAPHPGGTPPPTQPRSAEPQPVSPGGAPGQSPSVTYSYRPAPPAHGDLPALPLSGPQNLADLVAAPDIAAPDIAVPDIAGGTIFATTPAADTARQTLIRTSKAIAEMTQPGQPRGLIPWSNDLVRHIPATGTEGGSVFVGVRDAYTDLNSDTVAAARRAALVSATGSAAPTIMLAPRTSGHDADPAVPGAPFSLPVGFPTKDIRPTTLRPGDAATTTLGYTYIPFNRTPPAPPLQPPPVATLLSASITAPGGGLARHDVWDRPDRTPGPNVAATGTLGIDRLDTGPLPDPDPEHFLVATAGGGTTESVAIPLALAEEFKTPGNEDRSVFATQTVEMEESSGVAIYGLTALALLLPTSLAVLGFRLYRRAVLRRAEE